MMPLPWLQPMLERLPQLRSLRRQLLLWLILPQLVLWAAAAMVSYGIAARYANHAVDAGLLQATRSLARQVQPIGNGLLIDFPRAAQAIIESDPDDRAYYMVSQPPGEFLLGNKTLPLPPNVASIQGGETMLYDTMLEGVPIRVAALALRHGEPGQTPQMLLVQIARSRASREEVARGILRDIALPLSLLALLMSVIVWGGIQAGLAPLARVQALVEHRAPGNLAPIRLDSAPTELRSLVEALNTLLAAVQDSIAARQRFINDAAHQLRTPLAGLKSQTELALRENQDPLLDTRLERVHESATRSARLVTQLLTLARAEPDTSTPQEWAACDLRQLVSETTAELVPRALKAGVDLGLEEGPEDPLPVRGQALLLREALVNVLDNAIRYAGRDAEITVRVQRVDTNAVVQVDDTGPGIPPALHQRVFERFFQVTPTSSGCGLGLAIVRQIIERHGGSVAVASHTPHGLRVTMRMPLQR